MAENANKNRKIAGIFALVLGLLTAGFVVTVIVGVEQGWYAKKTNLEGYGAILVLVLSLFQIPLLSLAALAEIRHAITLFSPRDEQSFLPTDLGKERLAAWIEWAAFGVCVFFGVWWLTLLGQPIVAIALFALAILFAAQYFVERKILV